MKVVIFISSIILGLASVFLGSYFIEQNMKVYAIVALFAGGYYTGWLSLYLKILIKII